VTAATGRCSGARLFPTMDLGSAAVPTTSRIQSTYDGTIYGFGRTTGTDALDREGSSAGV